MCGGGTLPKQGYKHIAELNPPGSFLNKAFMHGYNKMPTQNESTPPILRSSSSSPPSGGPTSLGIRRESGSTRRQDVASSRRTSKSKRFSTMR